MHAALLSSWNHLPPTLNDATKNVLATDSGADYFKRFALLNEHLVAELDQLHGETPKGEASKPFRAAFCLRLTSARFVEMQKAIVAEEQGRTFWGRLRREDSAVADMASRAMMRKQLTSKRSAAAYEKVTKLNLSRLKWNVIPSEVFLLTKLEHLDLSQNQLTDLPKEISQLKNLVSINLAGNPLAAEASRGNASLQILSQLPLLREITFSDKAIDIATATTLSPASTRREAQETTRPDASPSRTRHASQTYIVFPDRSTYYGQVRDDKPHGEGILTYSRDNLLQRRTYKGPFAYGLPHGEGVIKFVQGQKFVGRIENGEMVAGKLSERDGSYAEGTFQDQKLWNGTRHIQGKTHTFVNGKEQNSNECCTIL